MQSQDNNSIVTQSPASPELVGRVRGVESSVVILPQRQADDGRGIYGEATLFLVKELRAEGVDASFLEDGAERLFEVKKSSLSDAIQMLSFAIGTGVLGNAAWASLKVLFKSGQPETDPPRDLDVNYLHLAETGEETQYRITGVADDVMKAIDHIRGDDPDDDSSGAGSVPDPE